MKNLITAILLAMVTQVSQFESVARADLSGAENSLNKPASLKTDLNHQRLIHKYFERQQGIKQAEGFSQPNAKTEALKIYSQRYEGGVNSGGGNTHDFEFDYRVLALITEILKLDSAVLAGYGINKSLLQDIKENFEIEPSAVPLFWDDAPVDAVNFPDEFGILYDAAAWDRKIDKEKDQLVVHELLGLMRIQDINSSKSMEIVQAVSGISESTNVLLCSTYVNGELVQSGVVPLFHRSMEPEGAGRAVIYKTDSYRIIGETYPLTIFVQIFESDGEVVDVLNNSKFTRATQFIVSLIRDQRRASLNKSYEGLKFKVKCEEREK